MRHHTKDKGDVGLGFVIADLLNNGIQVALPISEHLPFDLVAISQSGEMKRVSVKYRSETKGIIEVELKSKWADRHGTHTKKHSHASYDCTAIYCPGTKEVYYYRNDEVDGITIRLRTEPPKNGQKKGVKMASDYRESSRIFYPGGATDSAAVF